jgi:hypothetical protein
MHRVHYINGFWSHLKIKKNLHWKNKVNCMFLKDMFLFSLFLCGALRNVPVGGGCRKNKRSLLWHRWQILPLLPNSIRWLTWAAAGTRAFLVADPTRGEWNQGEWNQGEATGASTSTTRGPERRWTFRPVPSGCRSYRYFPDARALLSCRSYAILGIPLIDTPPDRDLQIVGMSRGRGWGRHEMDEGEVDDSPELLFPTSAR